MTYMIGSLHNSLTFVTLHHIQNLISLECLQHTTFDVLFAFAKAVEIIGNLF